MSYILYLTPDFEKQLKKIKQKDKVLFERIVKKLDEITNNPEHYKPLGNVLKGCRRVHIDQFVIVFEIKGEFVVAQYVRHHDEAY